MVRVLTGQQIQDKQAHEEYIKCFEFDLKPTSYRFYKSNPTCTPTQLRKVGSCGVVRFYVPIWNG